MPVSPLFITILQENNLWESVANLRELFQNGLISRSDLLSKMVQIISQTELDQNQKSQILKEIQRKSELEKFTKNLEKEKELNQKNSQNLELENTEISQNKKTQNLSNFDSTNFQSKNSNSAKLTNLSTNSATFSHSTFQFTNLENLNSENLDSNTQNSIQNSQKNSKTLIIGNGDVTSLADARLKVAEFGVDGVMIGRGILSNPYLFAEVEMSSKSVNEKLNLLILHLNLWEETWKNKNFGVLKKYFKIYLQGFAGAGEMRGQIMQSTNLQEARIIAQKWLEIYK